eukprot:4333103-Amphidinium_carterae.1
MEKERAQLALQLNEVYSFTSPQSMRPAFRAEHQRKEGNKGTCGTLWDDTVNARISAQVGGLSLQQAHMVNKTDAQCYLIELAE